MKKKSFLLKICSYGLILVLSLCLLLGLGGLKVGASSTLYRVNVDNAKCYIYFTTQDMPLAIGAGSTDLIIEPETNFRVNLQYDSTNHYFVVNNNTNYILQNNSLFCVCFENGINHFIFYQINLTGDANQRSNYSIVELFTLSVTTQTITYFNFFSQVLQFRLDNSTLFTEEQIIDNYYSRFNGGYFGSLLRTTRQNAYQGGYNQGRLEGYTDGYADGQAGNTALTNVWNMLAGLFDVVGSIMSIQIFPYVPLGLFFFVPLFFACVGLILWIWRRN